MWKYRVTTTAPCALRSELLKNGQFEMGFICGTPSNLSRIVGSVGSTSTSVTHGTYMRPRGSYVAGEQYEVVHATTIPSAYTADSAR